MPLNPQQKTSPEFVSLREFLALSSLSYVTYRRLRIAGMTPPEYKLSGKTILIKIKDAQRWLLKPPGKRKATVTAQPS